MKTSLRARIRALVSSHSSDREIAFGIAVGVFVSFSPLYGLQLLICLLVVVAIKRLNRAAVFIGVQASWVYPVMLYLDYVAGRWLLPGDHPDLGPAYFRKGAAAVWLLTKQLLYALVTANFRAVEWQDFSPLWGAIKRLFPVMVAGWCAAGALAGLFFYFLTIGLLALYRGRRGGARTPVADKARGVEITGTGGKR